MFRGSRAPWSRYEDRCDGAGSEADGTTPPVHSGPRIRCWGLWFFGGTSALVRLRSSGLRKIQARRPPGRFCPAIRMKIQSSFWAVRVRLMLAAFHIGVDGPLSSPSMAARAAAEGGGGFFLPLDGGGFVLASGADLRGSRQIAKLRYLSRKRMAIVPSNHHSTFTVPPRSPAVIEPCAI